MAVGGKTVRSICQKKAKVSDQKGQRMGKGGGQTTEKKLVSNRKGGYLYMSGSHGGPNKETLLLTGIKTSRGEKGGRQ